MITQKSETSEASIVENHSLLKSILLHLIPAILWAVFYIPLARIGVQYSIPSYFTMTLVFTLVVLPYMLGYLYFQGKKRFGKYTLQGIVLFREKMPWKLYIVFGIAIIAWVLLTLFGIGTPVASFFRESIFSWIPDWYLLDQGTPGENGAFIEISMWVLHFLIISFIGPLTEELYFRGYLLPRLSKLKKWAPLLNVVLFSAYHLWMPQYFLITIIAMLPFVYIVWWKKNIYLGIGVHLFINTLGLVVELINRINTF